MEALTTGWTTQAALISALVIVVAAGAVVGVSLAIRGAIRRHDSRLDPAREHLDLTLRRVADALGTATSTIVFAIGVGMQATDGPAETLLMLLTGISAGLAVVLATRGVGTGWVSALAAGLVVAALVLQDFLEPVNRLLAPLESLSVPLGDQRITALGVLTAAISLLVLYAAGRFVYRLVAVAAERHPHWNQAQKALTVKLAGIVLVTVAVIFAIDIAGLGGTMLTLFSGTLGLGIGFGLKNIFSNLVAGVLLLMDRSVSPGDTIAVDEAVGEVTDVGIRAVTVETRDRKVYIVPNETMVTETVENWGYGNTHVRESVTVNVAYDSDLDLVEKLLIDAAASTDRVLKDPAPGVRIVDLAPAGITHELRFWIADPEAGRANVKHVVYRSFLDSFAEHDIRLPSPGVEISRRPE